MSDIRTRLEALIRRHARIGEDVPISDATDLREDLGLGVRKLVALRAALEAEFAMILKDYDLDREGLGTFGGMLAFIERRDHANRTADDPVE